MIDKFLKRSLQCPNCLKPLYSIDEKLNCSRLCFHEKEVPEINKKLVLINFEDSLIDFDSLYGSKGDSSIKRNLKVHNLKRKIKGVLWGNNVKSEKNFIEIERLMSSKTSPHILIVGGGTIGDGMGDFLKKFQDNLCSFDVFYSENIDFIADAHQIPFNDNTFDLVIVQAVLEHVLDPYQVVSEVHRVLNSDGYVYAETPFMQQVHEGRYDFLRFTELGHIYLFKNFELLKSGNLNGLGTSLIWSLDYLFRGIFRSRIIGKLFKVTFFWIRFLDIIIADSNNRDGASGYFYLGKKSIRQLKPKEILNFYKGAQ